MGRVSRKRAGGVRKHPPSALYEADALALDRAVETMIQNSLSGWDHTRPLGSLNRDDLRKLATDAITGWILKRAELAKHDEQLAGEMATSVGCAAPTWEPPPG